MSRRVAWVVLIGGSYVLLSLPRCGDFLFLPAPIVGYSCTKNIIVGLIYRPSGLNATKDKELFEEITEASNSFDSVIFGDFNLPVSTWGNLITAHSGSELYSDILESNLSQHVNEPTRDDNILHIVLSNNHMLVYNVNVGPEFSTSDQKTLFFNINFYIFNESPRKENYLDKKGNFEKLRRILSDTDRNFFTQEMDIDNLWAKFSDTLNNAIKPCVPVGKRRKANRNNTKPKRWNRRIEKKLSQKDSAYRKYKITKSYTGKREYGVLRRETKKLIRENKKNIELYIANSGKSNSKEFYSYVRKKKKQLQQAWCNDACLWRRLSAGMGCIATLSN